MVVLPAQLEPYASLINLLLLFIDGLLFGFAAKKAVTSIILMVLAILLAGYIGLSIPFVSPTLIFSKLGTFAFTLYNAIGPIFFSYPIAFIAGIIVGFWKG
ncbi:MAG: hypothetical protein QXQ39_03295 [Conexivisphaerales archaeon]